MSENRGETPGPPPPQRRCVHPQCRLADEIMPYLRELDDRDWMPEERAFLEQEQRRAGRRWRSGRGASGSCRRG